VSTTSKNARPVRLWPLYAGGFLGPFGGTMVTPMLPELSEGLHTSLSVAASSLTVYLLPFAAIMIVSGTFAEHWGRRRTIWAAYLAYAVASLICLFAPNATVFLLGRALQGSANAFTSPLLVAAISDLVPRERLSRSLGHFGSMLAAGQAFAPLIGGAAAAIDYRLAFGASVLAAAGLALVPPPDAPRNVRETPVARWRSLLNPRLAVSSGTGFGLYLTTTGVMLLVALVAGDRFGLGPDARGLVVAAFGVAGLVGGSSLGHLADRIGTARFGVIALLSLAAATAAVGIAGSVAVLIALMALSGAASTSGRVTVNTLAVTSTPDNRGGATSITLSWQFLGSALAPVFFLPVYRLSPQLGLVTAASGAVAAATVVALLYVPAWRTLPRAAPAASRPTPS
jgi:MFS transporter, ACDE family, multidrug resistance protein